MLLLMKMRILQTMRPESGFRIAPNWPKIKKMTMTSNFLDVVLFLLSSLVTGPSFLSISSLVLELWLRIRDYKGYDKGLTRILEIRNTPVWVLLISGDWGELWIPNWAQMSLIKCYWVLKNVRVITFTVY